MPKPIKLTEEWIKKSTSEFISMLQNAKMRDGKINYTKAFEWEGAGKVNVWFTPAAFCKMIGLIKHNTAEVGWHGIVERRSSEIFVIKDILVYPQKVTGTTVTPDQTKYQTWMMELDDDTYNTMHMHGHSHVNMSTTPSSVDTSFQESMIAQLDDKGYYIFMIWNKKLEHTILVYDMDENTLYDDKDVCVGIADDDFDLESYIVESDSYIEVTEFSAKKSTVKAGKKKDVDDDDCSLSTRTYPQYTGLGTYAYSGYSSYDYR